MTYLSLRQRFPFHLRHLCALLFYCCLKELNPRLLLRYSIARQLRPLGKTKSPDPAYAHFLPARNPSLPPRDYRINPLMRSRRRIFRVLDPGV